MGRIIIEMTLFVFMMLVLQFTAALSVESEKGADDISTSILLETEAEDLSESLPLPIVARSQQPSYRILPQGINIEVSTILDKVEGYINSLFYKIHGVSADDRPQSRVNDAQDRIAGIVKDMEKIFPHIEHRVKREAIIDEQNEGVSESFDETFEKLNEANKNDGLKEIMSKLYDFGSNSVNTISEIYSLGTTTVSSFLKDSTASIGNTLSILAVKIGSEIQYRESLEKSFNLTELLNKNSNLTDSLRRRKRFTDFYDHQPAYGDRSSHDGYGHQTYNPYGNTGGYGKVDPYVGLAAIAACVFFGSIAFSIYCKLEGSPCCKSNTTSRAFDYNDDLNTYWL